MHDISLQDSANPSSHALNATDLFSEHTVEGNCQARLSKVLQKYSSQVPF